jgi:hypothetical protein
MFRQDYGDVRGFNYSGSWGTSGLDVWMHHDAGQMAVEVGRGKDYFPGWNAVRWWLSQPAYERAPERFLANFEMGLQVFAAHGVAVMPVLFNRWRDFECEFGGVFLDHLMPGHLGPSDIFVPDADRDPAVIEHLHGKFIDAVVGAHAEDDRIFAWDLCNEPLFGVNLGKDANAVSKTLREVEPRWLRWLYARCKAAGAVQPITVGNMQDVRLLELTNDSCDFLCFHPYYVWNLPGEIGTKEYFLKTVDKCVAFAERAGKPILATETGWAGTSDPDVRVEKLRYTLNALADRGIGFLVHALQHTLIADLHYPEYGPVTAPGVMHFIDPDGSLRPGHEAFNDF